MDNFSLKSSRHSGSVSRSSQFWLGALVFVNILMVLLLRAEPETAVREPTRQVVEPGLVLLAELSEAERETMRRRDQTNTERVVPLQPQPQAVCRIWGPFNERSTLEGIEQVVAAAGSVLEVKAEEIASDPDFLVYLETDNNVDNARRLLKELEAQLLDAYIIAGGDFINAVSVGVFSNEQGAKRQNDLLADLGYAPRIESLGRVQTVYHLIGQVPEDFQVETHGHADCPAIASAR